MSTSRGRQPEARPLRSNRPRPPQGPPARCRRRCGMSTKGRRTRTVVRGAGRTRDLPAIRHRRGVGAGIGHRLVPPHRRGSRESPRVAGPSLANALTRPLRYSQCSRCFRAASDWPGRRGRCRPTAADAGSCARGFRWWCYRSGTCPACLQMRRFPALGLDPHYLSTRLRTTPMMRKLGTVCVMSPIHVLWNRRVG